MKDVDTPIQNRRRRRATEQMANGQDQNNLAKCYDEDSYETEIKGHRRQHHIFSFEEFVSKNLVQKATSCTKRWHCFRKQELNKIFDTKRRKRTLLLGIVLLWTVLAIRFSSPSLPSSLSSSSNPGRSLTAMAPNQIRVTISKFDKRHNQKRDIGGWKHTRLRFFHPTRRLKLSNPLEHDFGGLKLFKTKNGQRKKGGHSFVKSLLTSNEFMPLPRDIHPDDDRKAAKHWEKLVEDTPEKLRSKDEFPENTQDRKEECRPPLFAKTYRPHCNLVHEVALVEKYDHAKYPVAPNDSFYISSGYFRDVFLIRQPFPGNLTSALKISNYESKWNTRMYWRIVNDALVMEELTASPRIVDIYGHCGGTIWVEGMPHEVEEFIIDQEKDGMMKSKDVPKELTSYNEYTVEEKLDTALTMAESIADLHGFKNGVIVHDDVQLSQWLKTGDGRLKLGDFNRAWVMEYDETNERYCKYKNGACYGNYRAPEEYDKDWLNEEIDVFSFGNNIYCLLTGLWNFYDVDDDEVVQEKVIKGTRAYIDPRWKERSFIESRLVDVMEKCWIGDVEKRIDIFGVVRELREIKKEHERRKTKNHADVTYNK